MIHTTLIQAMFAAIGFNKLKPQRPAKPTVELVDHHQRHASPDRKAWRALKRAKGFRQARMERKAERRAEREVVQ